MKKTERVCDRLLDMTHRVDMGLRVLIVVLSLWSSGLQAEDAHSPTVPNEVRLVGGDSHCAGGLEVIHQGDWGVAEDLMYDWNLTSAAAVCRLLDCGSAVSLQRTSGPSVNFMANFEGFLDMLSETPSSSMLHIRCSDFVRLLNGTNLCSGRLEVKSNHSNQRWSSVCEDDFDQQDAKVVCRELGCGAPSALKGVLYGEAEAPVWNKEFQCEDHESALLDCGISVSNTCSSGRAVELTCSEPADVRLVGGASWCSGNLEMNQFGEWKPVDQLDWTLKLAGIVCRQLDCGSVVSTRRGKMPSSRYNWGIKRDCAASSLNKCFTLPAYSSDSIELTCSDSVRLVNGTNLCSGRLEVKSNQLWYSVCEDNFDQQVAEVVCRELSCGTPFIFKGGLYGDVEAPVWTKEFQCGGHESALLDCGSSGWARKTCSPGKAVGLTCSDPDDFRLVGGTSRCSGRLELKHNDEWKPVDILDFGWNLKVTAVVCRRLDCGSAVSIQKNMDSPERSVWSINSYCVQSQSPLKECLTARYFYSSSSFEITCSDSVRLVNAASLCSGTLEVKSNQSNQWWSPVCEADFDQRDAEVVCRELGCGAPSVIQRRLYGEVEALARTKVFQCGGHESALLDCGGYGSARNTCSPGKAVRLTCSDPSDARLVGHNSRCAGTLEMINKGQWRPVNDWDSQWDETSAAAVCRLLHCGSLVSTQLIDDYLAEFGRLVWWIKPSCVLSASALLECLVLTEDTDTFFTLEVICSDLLNQPNISLSPSTDGVSYGKQQGLHVLLGSSFTITCSIEPQYQGGSFHLVFAASHAAQNYTLPAVNHSARFLFSAADHAHQGDYTCVYHVHVFSRNFSSKSQPLCLTVSASLTELMIRLVVILLGLALLITALTLRPAESRSHDKERSSEREEKDPVSRKQWTC